MWSGAVTTETTAASLSLGRFAPIFHGDGRGEIFMMQYFMKNKRKLYLNNWYHTFILLFCIFD